MDIRPGQIYRWRRLPANGNGFAQVVIAPVGDDARCLVAPAIEIEVAGKARVRIPVLIPPGLAMAVVKALSER
jgi:transposase